MKHKWEEMEADEELDYVIGKLPKARKCIFEEDTLSVDNESSEENASKSHVKEEVSIMEERKDKYKLVHLPSAIKQSEDSSRSLPDPFPLPVNYRRDVEDCLTEKHMTKSAKSAFFSSVAAAMFQYKRWPSRDEKVHVARQIESKYPFLGVAGFGRPSYEVIISSLEDKFKELRRGPKKKDKSTSASSLTATASIPKAKPHKPFELPPIPIGEDETSFQRHNKALKTEYSKASNITMTANKLMDLTFAQRRRDMMDSKDDVRTTFKKYPYLQESTQLVKKLDRIAMIESEKLQLEWIFNWVPKIIAQMQLEMKSSQILSTVYEEIMLYDWDDSIKAMCMVFRLLPDTRQKPNYQKAVTVVQTSSMQESVKKGQKPPYLLVTGSDKNWQVFLIVDKMIACETPTANIPAILVSAFYTFNILYPVGCQNAYSFLEYILFGSSVKVPTSVKNFIASLQNIT